MPADTTPDLGKPTAERRRARAANDEGARLDAAAASLEADARRMRAAAQDAYRRARAALAGEPEEPAS